MRGRTITIICLGLAVCFADLSAAQQEKEITCTGKVVDAEDRPMEGVKVTLYETKYNRQTSTYDVNTVDQAETGSDGTFSFKFVNEDSSYRHFYIVAQKEGLAPDFDDWSTRDGDKEFLLKLDKGKVLEGMVIDENDKPVAEAAVSISLMMKGESRDQKGLSGTVAKKLFTVQSDAAGRFSFANIPSEVTVDFILEKAGRATINTYKHAMYSNEKLRYNAGQTDIRLVMPLEAKVEGVVVQKDTGEPVGGIRVLVLNKGGLSQFRPAPVVSADDGTFSMGGLTPDTYTVQIARPTDQMTDWVADPVDVVTEVGKTKSGIKMELCKGGMLEIVFKDAVTSKPIEGANVSIRDRLSVLGMSAQSDANGIARLRLMPREYEINSAYKQGYSVQLSRKSVLILDGKTTREVYELTEVPKISGVVHSRYGRPVEGARLSILPGSVEEISSDSEGRFEISWDRRGWGEDAAFCLVARNEERNLAAAVEIDENTKNLDIKLEPGLTIVGKVVDPNGIGIPGADIRVTLRLSNWGSPMSREQVKTDGEGNYEIRAIPPGHNYGISAGADAYGGKDVSIHSDNAVKNRLEVETMELPPADLSITGCVVDIDDNPIANAGIYGHGNGQPQRCYTRTDSDGKFIFAHVCEGTINLRIDAEHENKRLSARVITDGGAENIKIVAKEGRPVVQYIGSKTYEEKMLAGKVIAGIVVDESGSPVAGVPVGVRCIKRKRDDGRFSWSFGGYDSLRDTTDKQGRFAIVLEENAWYNLLFSPDNQAAVIVYDIAVGTKDLKVTLPEGGTVTGRLVQMEGGEKIPVPNVVVKLEQTDRTSFTHLGFDRDKTAVTDSQGRFRFEHIQTKVRPRSSMSEDEWEPIPRVWQVSYGDNTESVTFYEDQKTREIELVAKPSTSAGSTMTGESIPAFDGIKINLNTDEIKDKMMLACFFDMNQRPSRNCIMQLNKRAEELKAKDIVLVGVQASKIDENTLDEWIKNSGVSYPVGLIETNIEDVKIKWGVKALPWLILTDKKHTVIAEGFGMDELGENISQIK